MPKYIDIIRSYRAGSNAEDDTLPEQEEIKPEEEKTPVSVQTNPAHASKNTSQPEALQASETWLRQSMVLMYSLLKVSAQNKPVRIERLRKHVETEIQTLLEDSAHLNALELKLSELAPEIHAMDTDFGSMIEKSMNMMLLSIKTAEQLNMEKEQITSLVLAAMLHHIGLARVPAEVRRKSDALSLEERRQIQKSVHQGAEYLRKCGIGEERILEAMEQSHERMDGSGPLGLSGGEISYLARIVGLLSFFEALIHFRPYRPRMLPRDAIREIILHHKQAFDTAILKALIDAVSLYPVGTYVQLNSGDIAQVIYVHPRLPLRPTIRLCLDKNHRQVPLREIDLRVQTTLQIELCMYPEDMEQVA